MSLLFFLFTFFVLPAHGQDAKQHQTIHIFVDISRVSAPDGSTGTSTILNSLVTQSAQNISVLQHRLNFFAGADVWTGDISVWDYTNVQYMPGYKKCDYNNSLKCGVQNNHWTIQTNVDVSDKYSVISQKLYNEKGEIIGSSYQTAWGKIRWKPRWKLTRIKEQGPFGGGSKEIFEMWPPEIEELPPLIKPLHISQSRHGMYEVKRKACKLIVCH